MKVINTNTILRQGSKEFKAVEVDGVIYWRDSTNTGQIDDYITNGLQIAKINVLTIDDPNKVNCSKIVAQSTNKLDGIPVISLDSYIDGLAINQYKNVGYSKEDSDLSTYVNAVKFGYNLNHYSQKDIEKALYDYNHLSFNEIINQLNQIQVIEVDEDFNIINIE